MMKKSWGFTIITQFSLCLSLFLVLYLCQNQKPMIRNVNVNNLPMDMYFISLTGGIRTLEEQTLLLKQVGKVAKKFNARFIINISKLGEDDPLMQNATRHFPSMKIPCRPQLVGTRLKLLEDEG